MQEEGKNSASAETNAMSINSIPVLLRREIEALIVAPVVNGFIEEFGKDKVLEVLKKTMASIAKKEGKFVAERIGGNSLEHLTKSVFPIFQNGGALECELLEGSENCSGADIKKCRYAEMYRKYGLEEIGYVISCSRDGYFFEGFNPQIKFTRSQTIMQGADFCDFRFETVLEK